MKQEIKQGGITLLGLGMGDASHLTRQAWEWLSGLDEVWLETRNHPAVAGLPQHLKINTVDDLVKVEKPGYPSAAQIAASVVTKVEDGCSITFAVPGHPLAAPDVCAVIIQQARVRGIPLQIIAGISLRDVASVDEPPTTNETPTSFLVVNSTEQVVQPAREAFANFLQIVARLRAPDGCPWDREQTHQSLRQHLLEETYETLSALDENDIPHMQEEFGDLLLQIVLHAQIASESGEFDMQDVIDGIHRKIVRRHPHVFGEVQVDGVGGVLRNWEKLKADERKENGEENRGQLDGVPLVFPALAQAQQYQERAARVGFDWPDIAPVLAKIHEELEEVRTAPDAGQRAAELGDLLFAVVNLVRWYKVDAESALRQTSQRFRSRFGYIEEQARRNKRSLTDMTLAEMDALWEKAKKCEKGE